MLSGSEAKEAPEFIRKEQNFPGQFYSTIQWVPQLPTITTPTVLLRRTALESIGGFQYIPGQCSPDIPTFVRLSREGEFHYTPEVLGFRRRHLGSATLQNLSSMPHAAQAYALQACKDPSLGLALKEQLLVEKSWQKVLQKSAFSQGRIALLNQQWQAARGKFVYAMQCGERRIVLAAVTGWIASWFHCDLETLFRLVGRTPLRQGKARNDSYIPA